MESNYDRYISNKRKNLATSNKQDLAREGRLLWSSFGAPLVLLWCSFGGSEMVWSGFEEDSERCAPSNVWEWVMKNRLRCLMNLCIQTDKPML